MKKITFLLFVVGFLGCRNQQNEPHWFDLRFFVSDTLGESSKTEVVSVGDQAGVFFGVEGTAAFAGDNVRFVAEADGATFSASPAVYYPDSRQATHIFAYMPYRGAWDGTWSVPTDQSTALALKQADLCWAKANSTPTAQAIPLRFAHLMARVVVSCTQTPSKITIPNAFSGGTLDIRSGVFTNTTKNDLSTTQNELIVPAQPLTRLVLTVSGVDYVFEPTSAVVLLAGQTTSLSLTLNAANKTANLAGSSLTNWVSQTASGTPQQTVSNLLTIHWPKCHPQSPSVNNIAFVIQGSGKTAQYTVTSGITYANNTFIVPFSSSQLQYPYIIQSIHLYNSTTWIHGSSNVLRAVIERAGSCVLGVDQPLNTPATSDYVTIGGLKWARSNLVAVNAHECRVGKNVYDGGVYFQFGSLIGWKGGDQLSSTGTGVGYPQPPLSTSTTPVYWSGSFSWAGEAMVWPREFIRGNNITSFPSNTTNLYYFGDNTVAGGYNINNYPGLSEGRLSVDAVGDPCTYYLGAPWRLPRIIEFVNLNAGVNPSAEYANASWSAWGSVFGAPGVFMGPDAKTYGAQTIFIPRVGLRKAQGAITEIDVYALALSSDSYSSIAMYYTVNDVLAVRTAWGNPRVFGLPARCVSN